MYQSAHCTNCRQRIPLGVHVTALQDGRRFQYGGYWFEIVEVWPVGWSHEDDCFIEQDGDDYYLVDAYHPGVRVAVIVVEG